MNVAHSFQQLAENQENINSMISGEHLSVWGHALIKILKDLIRTLVRLKYGSDGLMSHCLYDAMDKLAVVYPPNSSLGSVLNTDVLKSSCGLQGHCVLAEVSGHVYREKCQSTSYFWRLQSWTRSSFMMRTHSTAAVSGMITSDVNFTFSWFIHNHGFCFLQVWCPTLFASSGTLCPIKIWSPGYFVLYGVQKCAILHDFSSCRKALTFLLNTQ